MRNAKIVFGALFLLGYSLFCPLLEAKCCPPPSGILIDEMEASTKDLENYEDNYDDGCCCREEEYYEAKNPNEVSVPLYYRGCYDGDYDETWYYENSIERTWPSKFEDSWRDEITR